MDAIVAATAGESVQAVPSQRTVKMYLMRHAQSQNNVFPYQLFLGYPDPELTPEGREQAYESMMCLSEYQSPTLVMSSVLTRAQQTAMIAFKNQSSVYVMPFISEDHWGQPFLHPGSGPRPREQQVQLAEEGQDSGYWSGTVNFSLAPATTDECGPPEWSAFLSYAWKQPQLQQDLWQRVLDGEDVSFGVVSHGNFMKKLLRRHGFDEGHPHNAEVILAELPITTDSTGAATGLGAMKVTGIVCRGAHFPTAPKLLWSLVALLTICMCCCCCAAAKFNSRKRRLGLRSDDGVKVQEMAARP
eukprot:TRINITY_DN90616_c0_g1_i1.p1 TRINITY_DN90616_c0_g1~~TRINITY_DN90616_c0_g1_i1.p1  ORF type:complete len:344 (+),score=37.91 TRINITY_DN90616_c0_g1_i1:130-1032(+)